MLKKKGLSIGGLIFILVFIFAYNTHAETYNYARNPSFERIDGFGRPTLWVYINIPWVDYFPDEDEKAFGERSLRIVLGKGDSVYARDGGVWLTPSWRTISVRPNTTYTLSFYIKASDPYSVRAQPSIRGHTVDGRWVYSYYNYFSLYPGWQRVVYTFTPHEDVDFLTLAVWVTKRFASSLEEEQTVWIDGVQFEEGSTATEFSLPICVRETAGITNGRFADYLLGEDVDKPLRKTDGTIIQPAEVSDLYGTEDGMAIYDGGIDVGSLEYQAKMGYPRSLKSVYQNLSDEAGWPDIYVEPDTVGIDPLLGRFAFFSGDCSNIDGAVLKSRLWTGFGVPGSDIEVRGNYAYIAPIEGNFQILDISDKTKPEIIGHYAIGGSDVTVNGNYAYLPASHGVWALDISDPSNPIWPDAIFHGNKLWESTEGGWAREIAGKDGLLYVSVSNQDTCLYILDASDPLNLAEIGRLTIPQSNGAMQLFVSGNYAYLGMYNDGQYTGGVAIVDISDPTTPQLAGIYEGEGGSISYYEIPFLGIAPPYLIISKKAQASQPAELIIVDVSNPSQPERKGVYKFEIDGEVEPFVVLKRAVAKGTQESSLIYVTDCNRDTVQIGMQRGMAPTRLLTFDISSPENPQLVDEYLQSGLGKYRHLVQDEDYLYLTDANFGVRIFDLSIPSSPDQIGGVATAAENHYLTLSEDGKYAYVNQTFGGTVRIIDISDPGHPTEVGSYWDGEWNTRIQPKSKGNFLYLPHRWSVKILDVSDPTSPVMVDEFGPMPESIQHPDISLFGNYAYISISKKYVNDYQKLIFIYDLSNPGNPIQTSSILLTTTSHHSQAALLFAQGDYLYAMLKDEKSLFILDVSDPTSPQIISSLQGEDLTNGYKLYVSRGYAYIGTFERGSGRLLHIVDVSDPQNPLYVKLFEYPDTDYPPWGALGAEDIKIAGKYMYIGSYSNVLIFDISDPINPEYVGDTDLFGFRRQGWYGWDSWGAGWTSGELRGRYLFSPSLDHVNVIEILRDSQAPQEVTVSANLNPLPSIPDVDPLPDVTGQCSVTITDIPTATDEAVGTVIGTTTDPLTYAEQGTYVITWIYDDENGLVSTQEQTVIVDDTTPPTVVPQDISVYLDANGQASITAAQVNNGSSDNCGIASMTVSPNSFDCSNAGPNTVTLTIADVNGNVSSGTATVTVVDNIDPIITDLILSPNILWPPNHKMIPIAVEVTGSDNCAETTGITFDLFLITMNEGDENNTYDPYFDDNTGDGNTIDDIQVDEDGNILLRAERSGPGDGRVYTITYRVTDASGNSSTASETVICPHNQ